MIHFAVLFITVAILVIFLATKQRKPRDRFCLAATFLLCVLAGTSVVLLHGTSLFPASAFALAALILAHRSIAHFPVDLGADDERASCMHAARDALNHATWIVAAVVAGVVSACRV